MAHLAWQRMRGVHVQNDTRDHGALVTRNHVAKRVWVRPAPTAPPLRTVSALLAALYSFRSRRNARRRLGSRLPQLGGRVHRVGPRLPQMKSS